MLLSAFQSGEPAERIWASRPGTRLRRHWRSTSSWKRESSTGLSGARSFCMPWRKASYAAASSPARTTAFDLTPCLRAFWEEAALPSSVRGPVECWALARLAADWVDVDMGILLFAGWHRRV